jgi:predicted nucleic acid-binding protein
MNGNGNGRRNDKWLLDSNIIIDYLDKVPAVVRFLDMIEDDIFYVSVITRIELMSHPRNTKQSEDAVLEFLSYTEIVPLDVDVETIAIRLRQTTRLKLPDAIIAASAVAVDAVLITNDQRLASTNFSGLQTQTVN